MHTYIHTHIHTSQAIFPTHNVMCYAHAYIHTFTHISGHCFFPQSVMCYAHAYIHTYTHTFQAIFLPTERNMLCTRIYAYIYTYFRPFFLPTERDMVCETRWRPAYRCLFVRIWVCILLQYCDGLHGDVCLCGSKFAYICCRANELHMCLTWKCFGIHAYETRWRPACRCLFVRIWVCIHL
jgi:hypothetical protein